MKTSKELNVIIINDTDQVVYPYAEPYCSNGAKVNAAAIPPRSSKRLVWEQPGKAVHLHVAGLAMSWDNVGTDLELDSRDLPPELRYSVEMGEHHEAAADDRNVCTLRLKRTG